MPKKLNGAAIITAASARRLATAVVHGAYGRGIDKVSRVIDTVAAMTQRRQIDGRQRDAADTYRTAFDTLAASPGGQMDFDADMAPTPFACTGK